MDEPGSHSLFTYEDLAAGLRRGDFSRLALLFESAPDAGSPITQWLREGRFDHDRAMLNEVVTCACFLGITPMVSFLIEHGADPVAGIGTGMNGLHWASNRGQLDTVQYLVTRDLSLEVRNSYGGTVLGGTVWASVHEPKPEHPAIIEVLLMAGADIANAEYPSGNAEVDRILEHHGAK
ncbi:MAG: ankyrin repeat domain-containing protein [Gemmatimonadota bacterium]